MQMLNILNSSVLQQISTQYIPSISLDLEATARAFFDESFPLETRDFNDVVKFNILSLSTLLNDVLSTVVAITNEAPNFLGSIIIIFIFSKMYSKSKTKDLSVKTLLLFKQLMLLNALSFFTFFGIRAFLLILPSYYQTKYWLNTSICSFFLSNDLVWNSLITSILFLVVFMLLHLFVSTNPSIKKISSEVYILTFIIACFSWILLEVTDFALFIICLEGFSLSLYILATTGRTYGGVSAAIKYFVFGTLGSIFLYWGSLCIFEISSTMRLDLIKELTTVSISSSFTETSSKLIWAQSLILLGFLVKLGAAPLHQWIVDVYSGVPLFITAFYATFVKMVLFILFLHFATSFVSTKEIEYAAIFSLVVGCFGTLRQVEIKRFLAFSSITHTGYLLMGDLSTSYVYLVTYLLASLMFFSVIINLQLNSKELIYLTDLRFVGQLSSPLSRVILTISLASMAGLPPFAGFYGKMAVWMSLIEDIYLFNDLWSYVLFTANILTSLIAMFYYAQVMCILFVNNENVKDNLITLNSQNALFYIQTGGVVLLTLWTLVMPYFLTLLQITL
jgi:NADH-quinone oxidoreductase subunit N